MSILHIVKIPDEILHQKSKDVEYFDKKLKNLVDNMFETMYKFDGIGLAAVQVGILKKVIVIDIDTQDEQFKSEIINPEILEFSKDVSEMEEGCLSIPKKKYNITRPNKIKVKFYKLDGKSYEIEADGLLAKCFQHEIDHINGITIADKFNDNQ